MNIVSAWKDSLTLFIPKNFKLFLLVTLKSIVETYKVWLKYWGWLLGVYFLVQTRLLTSLVPSVDAVTVTLSLGMLLYFRLFLSMRPSIALKDFNYAMGYWRHFLFFVLFFLFCQQSSKFLLARISGDNFLMDIPQIGFGLALFTLFLLDSDGSLLNVYRSLVRAIKMLVYNLPFCLVSMVGLFGLFAGLAYLLVLITTHQVVSNILFVLAPIPLCYITNFYVKKLHDQFTLYFPQR